MDTLESAKRYLVDSQLPDGSWGSGDPYVCARALLALCADAPDGPCDDTPDGPCDDTPDGPCDDTPDGALARGLRYMESRQGPDGRFIPTTGMYSDATTTAYALIALSRFGYGKASLPVSRGIRWLLENQNEDGSWGTNKKKRAYTTTFGLRALHTFYLSGIHRFARGLEFSSGYIERPEFWGEPVSHVYAPILNLKRVDRLAGDAGKKFIEYARAAARDAAGGNVADSAYLLGTLKALGEKDAAATIEGWLAAARNEDGGFGKATGTGSDPGSTALAILAMADRL